MADEGELEFADSALATAGEKSPGLSARGKGGIYAWDNIVGTTGSESPALLMETGEGSMILDGGYVLRRPVSSRLPYARRERHGSTGPTLNSRK